MTVYGAQDKGAFFTRTAKKLSLRQPFSVDQSEVELAIACAHPISVFTAIEFCKLIATFAFYDKTPCRDVIASAGAIEVIMQLIEHFHDTRSVQYEACGALYCLVYYGQAASTTIYLTLQAQPNIVTLLRAASARFQEWDKYDYAELVLEKLKL